MLVGSLVVVLGKRMDEDDDDVEVLLPLVVAVVLGSNAKEFDLVALALERAVARFNIIIW